MSMVTKTKKKKPLTLRQVLNVIDARLAKGGVDAGKLWDVLSALRGPDEDVKHNKDTTTVPIRLAAFPKTARLSWPPAQFTNGDRPIEVPDTDGHFERHIRVAAYALN